MSGTEKCKLSQEQINNLLIDYFNKVKVKDIAEKYKIDHSIIYYYLEKYGVKTKNKLSQEIKTAIFEELKDPVKTKQSIADKIGVKLSVVQYYDTYKPNKKVKNYADFLKVENEKRKAGGLYQFKNGLAKEKAFCYSQNKVCNPIV